MNLAKFERQFLRASEEGRLHPDIAKILGLPTGAHRCKKCGMLAYEPEDARDCCTLPDRDNALSRGKPHPMAANIDNPAELIAAVDIKRLLMAASFDDFHDTISPINRGLRRRILRGEVKGFKHETWRKLRTMFGDKVPGCTETAHGRIAT